MKPRRVTYIVELQRDGQWWPVAAWWTRKQAREDVQERNKRSLGWDKIRIIDYRPLEEWGSASLRYQWRPEHDKVER